MLLLLLVGISQCTALSGDHGHGHGGVTYEGLTLHPAASWHTAVGTGLSGLMWFWVFVRWSKDGSTLLVRRLSSARCVLLDMREIIPCFFIAQGAELTWNPVCFVVSSLGTHPTSSTKTTTAITTTLIRCFITRAQRSEQRIASTGGSEHLGRALRLYR